MFDVGRIGWIFILRGALAFLIAVTTLANPEMATMGLLFAFALYAFTDGIFTLGAAFRHADEGLRPWGALFVGGIVSAAAGSIALFLAHITPAALLFFIAAWAMVTGAMWIVAALYLRSHIVEESLLAITGMLTVVFGVAIALFAFAGAGLPVMWFSAYALVNGAILIALGAKLRTWMAPGLDEFEHRFSPAAQYYVH